MPRVRTTADGSVWNQSRAKCEPRGTTLQSIMILVVIGIAVGLTIALASSRFVATLLFGLPPTDIMTMGLAMTVMVAVSALAGYLPARRASRVDPMVALHYE